MPDDLLSHLIGPSPYSSAWLWTAVMLALGVIVWYAVVFALTSRRRLRDIPVLGAARDELIRRRAVRAVRTIGSRYRAGELAPARAGAAMSGELRSFLHAATGMDAEYMQVDAMTVGTLAPAAPILFELTDVQFNHRSAVDVGALSAATEELIREWT
ncbi:hypothetical protein BST13_34795 [Mycobacterium aquaticum]|uniref:Uncharacterized protein n=1 Tax=Mycobacterium aquaticum TaxID=1927124 RepID=A0A1X0A0W2_9MYCO|nr:hypothetical protein [Mycobacterium aquaticum]ORA23624.1 hypothetical protein BST13_34795 [Mycobacterium aquaticum]